MWCWPEGHQRSALRAEARSQAFQSACACGGAFESHETSALHARVLSVLSVLPGERAQAWLRSSPPSAPPRPVARRASERRSLEPLRGRTHRPSSTRCGGTSSSGRCPLRCVRAYNSFQGATGKHLKHSLQTAGTRCCVSPHQCSPCAYVSPRLRPPPPSLRPPALLRATPREDARCFRAARSAEASIGTRCTHLRARRRQAGVQCCAAALPGGAWPLPPPQPRP